MSGSDVIPQSVSKDSPPWWKSLLTWSVLLTVGVLLYELTTQPLLAMIVVCLKFSSNYFRLAFTVRRVDTNRVRGRAYFWFYVATGLLWTSLVANGFCWLFLALIVVFEGVLKIQQFRAFLIPALLGTALTLSLALVVSSLPIIRGFWIAWRAGLRVWLNVWFVTARPENGNYAQENAAAGYLGLAIFIPYFALAEAVLLFGYVSGILSDRNLQLPCILLLFFILMGFVLKKLFALLKERLVAVSAEEAWQGSFIGAVVNSSIGGHAKVRLLASLRGPRTNRRETASGSVSNLFLEGLDLE